MYTHTNLKCTGAHFGLDAGTIRVHDAFVVKYTAEAQSKLPLQILSVARLILGVHLSVQAR